MQMTNLDNCDFSFILQLHKIPNQRFTTHLTVQVQYVLHVISKDDTAVCQRKWYL